MNWNLTDTRGIRKFGCIAFVFFGCLCVLGLWSKKTFCVYIFGFLSIIGLGFILIPSHLRPVYVAWLTISHFVGRVITTIVLTMAYYLVITPTALIKRLFSGPSLPLKPDKNASTYWVTRDEPSQAKERFLKRY